MSMNKNNRVAADGRKRRRWTAERRKDFLQSIAYLAPSVIGVLVFFVVPFGIVVYYSLIQGPADPTFVGLTNFKNLLGNYAFQTAIKNTATFSLMAVPLAVVLGLGLALLLEAKIPGKSMFRTFFLSPMLVPVASVVLVWQSSSMPAAR